MSKFILLITLCFFSLSTAFASANNLDVSFLQTAEQVTLTPVNSKEGVYKLTLQKIRPYVTYYSNRPNRVIGQISNVKFYTKWQQGKNSFSQDAPNAVLNGIADMNNHIHSVNVMMSLSHPVYDKASKSITYEVRILSKDQGIHLARSYYYVTLFIDNACLTCVG